MTPQNKIRQAFSETANQYDQRTSLHRQISRELMAKVIKASKAQSILDIGCGTGYLTAQAQFYFPKSKIIGLDFAEGMLKKAEQQHKGIEWVLGNAQELPFDDGNFDLVVSNLAYQWVDDLSKAFEQAKRVLAPKGIFAATLFGFHTCDELFQSLAEASHQTLKFTRLPKVANVKEALEKSGLMHMQVESQLIKVQFKDMWDLIAWLKFIGANNLPREGKASKDVMVKAAHFYEEKFPFHQGVSTTFEVIWIYGYKRER